MFIVGFLIGAFISTVVWFFVLRNNRKHIVKILGLPDIAATDAKYYAKKLDEFIADVNMQSRELGAQATKLFKRR